MALGEFNGIADVEVNNSDNIVVVDKFNNRIQVCSDQGDCMAFEVEVSF